MNVMFVGILFLSELFQNQFILILEKNVNQTTISS